MKTKVEENVLTLFPEGHIDSANAAAVEEEINAAISGHEDKDWVIDAENLSYLSSVGLRIVLRLKKSNPNLKIINVTPEVYEIFDMTGFTEMMDISKAYRRLSVEGCDVIGQGSNGKVYRLDSDTIIKVYFNSDALPDIHRERELARKAFVLGIPTAIPYDVVRVGDSYGSVFELLSAESFASIITSQPERYDEIIDLYVDLLKKIHSTEVKPGDMPIMKEVAVNWAKYLEPHLPADQYNKLLSLIEAVPERTTMMHGDYHLKNLMMQNGETLLIDMDTLCVGHPVFEFASVWLAYCGFGEVDHNVTLRFLGMPYDLTTRIYQSTLEKYFGTTDKDKLDVYGDKAKIVGYTRLLRRTLKREPENTAVIENCKKQLGELLARVDSLDF